MRTSAALTLTLCGALIACARERAAPEPVLTPAARRAPEQERALLAISEARCEHSVRCATESGVERYKDRDACMDAMLADGHAELARCRQSVELERVEACLSTIQELACAPGETGLGAVEPCSAKRLCPGGEVTTTTVPASLL